MGKAFEIFGATESTYTIAEVSPADSEYSFKCVLNSPDGQTKTSQYAPLLVYTNPTITNPANQFKNSGESASFTVTTGGSAVDKIIQWQVNKGSGYSDISGANAATLSIANLLEDDAGSYRCKLSNTCKIVYSEPAVLRVNEARYPDGWVKQNSETNQDIYSISHISDLKAWAVSIGESDKLLKTVDGGITWTSKSTGYSGNWRSIYFNSATSGFVGGDNGISRTLNSGANWVYKNLHTQFMLGGSDVFRIENFHFPSNEVGYGVGWYGLIVKTTDAGNNWTKLNYKGSNIPQTDVNMYTIFFIDTETGWVAGANGKIYKTSNGGGMWTEQNSTTSQTIQEIAFINATIGFFITNETQGIYKTTNGGESWTKINAANIPIGVKLNSLSIVDETFAYAAGSKNNHACIIKTYNGGENWIEQKINSSQETLHRIRMFDVNHGLAVGKGGDIHSTGAGGCHSPYVNLYDDKSLCAGQTINLVADTFHMNVNDVRYLWNNSSTAGNIIAGNSAKYKVTVSNECNVSISDSMILTIKDLPPAKAGEGCVCMPWKQCSVKCFRRNKLFMEQ
jgi:photosystem II stability/assembly factor-like uncharacterized protein